MPPGGQPPDFSSQAYWQTRFSTAGGEPAAGFEWLGLPPALASVAHSWLAALERQPTQTLTEGASTPLSVLHIGSGSSSLSFDLRRALPEGRDPACILNVDYAPAAVAWGRRRERELFGSQPSSSEGESSQLSMRWEAVDLLDPRAVVASVGAPKSGSGAPILILDKSTSDALSCGPSLPSPSDYARTVYPLEALAENLARAAPESSTWAVFSYSQDRFGGYDLGGLWDVVRHEMVDVEQDGADAADGDVKGREARVGRPRVQHGLTVLRRTSRAAPPIA